jgi:hypothetical protein
MIAVHGDGTGWLREEDEGKRRWFVSLADMRWLRKPVLRAVLKADPRFEDARILASPRRHESVPGDG